MTADLQPEAKSPSRRAVLAGALGGIGAWAASAIGRATPVRAANGDTVHVGDTLSGTATTTIEKTTADGSAIWGNASAATGTGVGVRGDSAADGRGVWGSNATVGYGVFGSGASGVGVYGEASAGVGVSGFSNWYPGVVGLSDSSYGVHGTSFSGTGVRGDGATGVSGIGNVGVRGEGTTGVRGFSADLGGIGVLGVSDPSGGEAGTSTAVAGTSSNGIGVSGFSSLYIGVQGSSEEPGQPAILGQHAVDGTGIQGHSGAGSPPAAKPKTGVYGYAAQDSTSKGVFGESPAGYAGYFVGRVYMSKYQEMTEISAPGAPGVNKARLFVRDNGSGKTQLCVRFNTGAIRVLATQA